MSLDDRDWWREDRKRKEEMYGGNFSLNSKPIKKSNKDTPTQGNNTNVMNKPLSLTSGFVFAVICFVGIYILNYNIIAVIIVASIGAAMPEIMKLDKGKRAEAALKIIIYTFSIFAGTAASILIILLLIAKFMK
ncbi:MAG: hypothetical protein E7232_15205 [Lachnospiraceae bacterium]|nr:hypothetical protein [Lachnospiraceae bacterium]